ncbi:MAG: ABC transporter substrate-binding protein, partial [Pseudomonadota bacterium]
MKLTKLLAGTAISLAIGLGAVSANAKELTVVSWGGAYTKSQVEAYHKPFIAKTGAKINSEDYNGGIAEIKAQVEAGNVTWDIVDVELSD